MSDKDFEIVNLLHYKAAKEALEATSKKAAAAAPKEFLPDGDALLAAYPFLADDRDGYLLFGTPPLDPPEP